MSLRAQGGNDWPVTLFGSDSPAAIWEVASGKVQFAIINPSMILKLAALGSPPFTDPLPLRAIAVLPSSDQMIFAVTEQTGLKSFTDIRERRFPLKVSLRGQPDHSLHVITNHVLSAAGCSLDDIVSGAAKSDMTPACPTASIASAPYNAARFTLFSMKAPAPGATWRWNWNDFFSSGRGPFAALGNLGLRRGLIERTNFPKLASDVSTLDFSGWPIYTHKDTADSSGHGFLPGVGGEQRSHSLGGGRPASSRANGARHPRGSPRSAAASRGRTVLAGTRLYIKAKFLIRDPPQADPPATPANSRRSPHLLPLPLG